MFASIIFFGLVITSQAKEDNEFCRQFRAVTCIDDRGLTCSDNKNYFNACIEELFKNAENCNDDVKNTLSARLKSFQSVQSAACGDKELQKAFTKSICWHRTAKCVVGMMLKPLTYNMTKPLLSDCNDAIGGLNSCVFVNSGDCDDGVVKKLVDKVKKDIPCGSSVIEEFSVILLVILANVIQIWN